MKFSDMFEEKKSSGLLKVLFILFCLLLQALQLSSASWDDWWTYDGISGPDFWGLLNPDWHLCNKGRRQSPIDIKPGLLLYDPELRPIHVDKHRVSGLLENNGHSIVFRVQEEVTPTFEEGNEVASSPVAPKSPASVSISISGGPLSYTYTFDSIHMHFGRTDSYGSEHSVAGLMFPAELGNSSNMELRLLTSLVHHIRYRGQNITIKSLSVRELIPDPDFYMTYEGSMTIPGCQETVTWIVINKPIFITRQQLYALRKLMQGELDAPKAPLGNNFRPIQSLNHRVVRTNIDFKRKQGADCPTMKRSMHYQSKQSPCHSLACPDLSSRPRKMKP